MHQRHRIRLDRVEHRGAARHAAGVPVFELAAGDQHHRVLGVGALVGRDDIGRYEARAARLAREGLGEHHRLARVALLHARIGHRMLALQALPRDAADARHRVAHLVEHFRHVAVLPVEAKLLRHLLDDPQVLLGVARRVDGLAADLHQAVGVGEAAGLFREGGSRQDHVGQVAVSVRKMSCTTRWSSAASDSRAWFASGSDMAGFSPMMYMPRILPCARSRP